MDINLQLPDGSSAHTVALGVAKLNIETLNLSIEVVGFDADGNKRIIIYVPYTLDTLREVTQDEMEKIVTDYFGAGLS